MFIYICMQQLPMRFAMARTNILVTFHAGVLLHTAYGKNCSSQASQQTLRCRSFVTGAARKAWKPQSETALARSSGAPRRAARRFLNSLQVRCLALRGDTILCHGAYVAAASWTFRVAHCLTAGLESREGPGSRNFLQGSRTRFGNHT